MRANDKKITIVFRYILLTIGAILMIIPFIWLILTAFKTTQELQTNPLAILPQTWRWQNFVDVFKTAPFGKYFINVHTVLLSDKRDGSFCHIQ